MSILLATLNARYHHCAFGLRYLLANMGDLRPATRICEFTIQQPTLEIVAEILSHEPRIVGFGVYIWNVAETTRVIADLKRLRPEITVIVGGPEVSYEIDEQEICRLADVVIAGEGDLAFGDVCRELMGGGGPQNGKRLRAVNASVPDLNAIALPYDLYSDDDIAHRVIYVEASRGCPFTCEFCLSALDIPVRQFPLDKFLTAMQSLIDRGARQFKFVDRTFNLNLKTSRAILEFLLDRDPSRFFLHFELIPDRLPESLRELIVRFPPGSLQFEIGIQTFNESVGELISRKQNNAVAEENLRWLRSETSVHLHTDLIVGLPGESLEIFAAGFDRLVALEPQEIQVGILKRLRGTPITRHDAEWSMIYSPHSPYEVLATNLLDFATLQELRRFAKLWDTIANSGNFVETLPFILRCDAGPFVAFRRFARWMFEQTGRTHSLALTRQVELVFDYLTQACRMSADEIAPVLLRDYRRGGRSDTPVCLRENLRESPTIAITAKNAPTPSRQKRQLDRDA